MKIGRSVKFLLILGLWLQPNVGRADIISVGGTTVDIPNPPGFAPITAQMTGLYEWQRETEPPGNKEFMSYIAESEIPWVLSHKSEVPDLERRFSVQTAKSLIDVSLSRSDFLKIKQGIKTKNDEIFRKVEKLIPGIIQNANKDIIKQFGADRALSIPQIVPLPPHEETDRTLAYSGLLKYESKDESANPTSYVMVVTSTFIHVKAKVLFLYSWAEESGLEWSRNVSKEWADAIVAANPGDLESSVKEALPSPIVGVGTDWGKVASMAILGVILASYTALKRTRNPKKPNPASTTDAIRG